MIQCADLNAVDRYKGIPALPEPDRPVDPGTGIPAAVGLVGIEGLYKDLILFAVPEIFRSVHIEIGVPVRSLTGPDAIDIHFSVMINALELQDLCLALIFRRHIYDFAVFVIIPRIVTDIPLPDAPAGPGLRDHCVVGNGNCLEFTSGRYTAYFPVLVKICSFHIFLLLGDDDQLTGNS